MIYSITLEDITLLADALSAADGHVPCDSPDKPYIAAAHALLIAVLGEDARLVYGPEEEQ